MSLVPENHGNTEALCFAAAWAAKVVCSVLSRDLRMGTCLTLAEGCRVGAQEAEAIWEVIQLAQLRPGRVGSQAEPDNTATASPAHCLQEHRGLLSIRYPMEHGIVKDWNDMERIWQYVYSKDQLQTFSEEVRVLCTGSPHEV